MANPYYYQKRIWITGASSGIGEALAYACAARGAQLILSARNEDALQQVASTAAELGAGHVFVQKIDLEQYETIPGIAETVLQQVGKVDILINCGGLSQRGMAMDTPLTVVKRLMDINYLGTVALTTAVLPNMLTHQLGHIVTVTSLTGKFGSPKRSAYAGSKHALHGYFDSLRAELANTPVRV
ncbi:MAG: SDR family NAD(P)-dependent oxidoreductase, partial [Bacteroidetes bacterium]